MESSIFQYGEPRMKTGNKQLIIVTLTIAAFLFLVWQVYTLIHTDITPNNTAKANTFRTTAQEVTILKPPQQKSLPPHMKTVPVFNAHQKEYMELISKYQLAKMQRQLLEEEVEIASAQQRIAVLNLQTRKLTGEKNLPSTFQDNEIHETHQKDPYQLAYLDHQGKDWTAILYKDGHYQEITAGTALEDGKRVVAVNQQGVVLKQAHQRFLLSFNGMTAEPTVQLTQKKPIDNVPVLNDFYNLSHIQNHLLNTLLPTNQKVLPRIHAQQPIVAMQKVWPVTTAESKNASIPLESTMKPLHDAPRVIKAYTLDEILLLELPPSSYTIELKGSFNKQSLEQLAEMNNLGPKATYYTITRDGKPWFTLLYDHFNTKQEAETKLKQLPETLLQQKPQLQVVAEIQQAIKMQKLENPLFRQG